MAIGRVRMTRLYEGLQETRIYPRLSNANTSLHLNQCDGELGPAWPHIMHCIVMAGEGGGGANAVGS